MAPPPTPTTTALADGRTMEVTAEADTLRVAFRYLMRAECTLRRRQAGAGWQLTSKREAHNACHVLFGDDGESRRRALAGALRQAAGGDPVAVPTDPPYIYLPAGYRFQPVFEGWVREGSGGGPAKRKKIHPTHA